ncbi:nucleotidyltransferase domain-containing protein [Natrinema caseinilyticum]|uniref:nucleotidyltransferase domain-containing protein n=1 Tax=Natrinema caseinilyticum TaxID=2961570 RepID=UPI0020C58426|nr:nucleotidyltransferase domain-containing protein [Natrinema caseinilyticum]
MRTSEEATIGKSLIDKSLLLETRREDLQVHSIQLAILFGSHASGQSHSRSDVDIAVEFDTVRPSDPDYNEAFLG